MINKRLLYITDGDSGIMRIEIPDLTVILKNCVSPLRLAGDIYSRLKPCQSVEV